MNNTIFITKISINNVFEFFLMITSYFHYFANVAIFLTFNFTHKFLKASNVSDFSLKKSIQVNLEKSSTHTKILHVMLSIRIGPIRSICNSSNTLVVEICCSTLCVVFNYLPNWHGPHIVNDCLPDVGKPQTIFAFGILFKVLKFKCPSFSCHRSISFVVVLWQVCDTSVKV